MDKFFSQTHCDRCGCELNAKPSSAATGITKALDFNHITTGATTA